MNREKTTGHSRELLLAAIHRLEIRQQEEIRALKRDMHAVHESLKPEHVVKTLVSELFTSPEVRKDLFQAGIGFGAGYLAKRAIIGKSHHLFKRLMGHFAQIGVTNMVNENEEAILSKGKSLVRLLIKRYRPEREKADQPGENPE